MYAEGRPHPLKGPCEAILELAGEHLGSFLTSAEVLQEIVHRNLAQNSWEVGKQLLLESVTLMENRIEPMLPQDVVSAAKLADCYPALSARDLIHVAIAVRAGATHIVSADTAFDVVTEIERLDPLRVAEWRGEVSAQ